MSLTVFTFTDILQKMDYTDSFFKLREAFSTKNAKTTIDNLDIIRQEFHSESYYLLPGEDDYECKTHDVGFHDTYSFFNEVGTIEDEIHVNDVNVEENRSFSYFIMKPKNCSRINNSVLMLHGFNEKSWEKYLPWAKEICERTQRAVILFPMAFHMHRAPQQWSDKRKMFYLSEKRKERFPNIINSTFSNVAISMRLHSMPQRFIWSGLQTYYDIIRFIEDCKKGLNELIDKDFTFDIFAYSIGGFLSEILKLTNYKNYFSKVKICLFCSGSVFNRMSPVSKFILDSEANVALYSCLVEHFESFIKKDQRLAHYISEKHNEGKVLHAMLDYRIMREFREDLFKLYEKHIYAISLKRDTVIPTFEIINTLKGAERKIDITVEELDFNYDYTHENPFPVSNTNKESVDESFKLVFDKVCSFLR